MKFLSIFLLPVFIITSALRCGQSETEKVEVTKLIYEFGDSSVPPRYHRSYEISVTIDSVELVIDSYGDILVDTQFVITENEFVSLVQALETSQIKKCSRKKDNDGCTGGTSETIRYFGKDVEFGASVYHCAGQDFGELCGDVNAFSTEIKNLIPDLSKILSSTEE